MTLEGLCTPHPEMQTVAKDETMKFGKSQVVVKGLGPKRSRKIDYDQFLS